MVSNFPIKKLLTILTTVVVVAVTALTMGGANATDHNDFVGSWDGFDTKGNPYTLALFENGTAEGTLESGMTGLWQVRDDVAYIEWNNDWKAMIVESGDGYTKLAFGPGRGFSSVPDGISSITKN